MDTNLVAKSLCFHGQPLQKIWEGERGGHDLYKIGLTNPDFSVYATRQKHLTFQDRAKRLKLHQFIARKANVLFDNSLVVEEVGSRYKEKTAQEALMVLPPFESYLSKAIDKSRHVHKILEIIQSGDIVYGQVLQRTTNVIVVKILCTGEPVIRFLADIPIKAYVLNQNLIQAHDKHGNPKSYMINDYVCCEVLEISADADRMSLGMKGTLTIDAKAPLGLITAEQLPEYYKLTLDNLGNSFTDAIEQSNDFYNPSCVDNILQAVDLSFGVIYSNMSSLKCFPQQEYAHELRQIQASKWAFRSVADGIEHFKVGRHSEAFQCLNKALSIDPRNVEGLVARGALYANSGSFKKAVNDFETALKLNPYHANARKYMGETLVALGRSYEEENRLDEARKAYKDCLNIIPHHEEAKSSLEFLNGKQSQTKQLIDANELVPGYHKVMETTFKQSDNSGSDITPFKKFDDISKKEKSLKKKKKNKNHHKRKNTSSSSDSDDSSNSCSSSSSESSDSSNNSSSSSDSTSTDKQLKSKRNDNKYNKQRSLSPLSKRMAIMDEQNPMSATRYQFNQPFHLANANVQPVTSTSSTNNTNFGEKITETDDYDTKVRNFLEMTRDEDDYGPRVRSLVEEVSKYCKERKFSDEKSKKKEKKKQKKLKKESKKSKKKKSKEKKSNIEDIDNMQLKEALQIVKSLPMIDFESKLTSDLHKYERSIEAITQRNAPSTSKSKSEYFRKESESPQRKRLDSPVKNVKKPSSPPRPPPFTMNNIPSEPLNVPQIKAPIVLDKFGCFRLAAPDENLGFKKSMSPSVRRHFSRSKSPSSRSPSKSNNRGRMSRSPRRSRSQRRSRSLRRSRSRSRRRSRSTHRTKRNSPRRSPGGRWSPKRRSPRRRSRSPRGRSFTRRSISRSRRFSRSKSRSSYRRSRSPYSRRSRSIEFGGRYRRSFSRSPSYNRSRSRSPWRRGGRGRGFRNRGFSFRGRGRGRGNFRGRRSPFFRGRNYSPNRSPIRRKSNESEVSPDRTSKSGAGGNNKTSKDGIEGKWIHDKYEKSGSTEIEKAEAGSSSFKKGEENWDDDENAAEPSVEEIDKIIDKAQKERKEEILLRDKDLLKKQTPTNLPF